MIQQQIQLNDIIEAVNEELYQYALSKGIPIHYKAKEIQLFSAPGAFIIHVDRRHNIETSIVHLYQWTMSKGLNKENITMNDVDCYIAELMIAYLKSVDTKIKYEIATLN